MSRNAPFITINVLLAAQFCAALLLLHAEAPPLSTSHDLPSRARVVIVVDDAATDFYQPNAEHVRALVNRGITNFTRKASVPDAWRSLVSTQDVVGIKVFSAPGRVGTRPEVVEGVIEGLLAAKLARSNIIVWDRKLADLRRSGFVELAQKKNVRVAGALESGWDSTSFYESSFLGNLVYGDLEFRRSGANLGRKSFVTMLLASNVTKVISVAPLLNHNTAGVCGNLYSVALGSVDNSFRFEGDPTGLAMAVPEIYALPQIGERVVLNIIDALICQYQGEQISHLHYSAPLNQLWFSKDPVALDALAIEELQRQRAIVHPDHPARTNGFRLLHNAELLELGVAELRRVDIEPDPLRK